MCLINNKVNCQKITFRDKNESVVKAVEAVQYVRQKRPAYYRIGRLLMNRGRIIFRLYLQIQWSNSCLF
jgi:hypothetical protein